MNLAKTVEEYIETFSPDVQKLLQNVRTVILKEAPGATESISYGMPAYKLKGKPLVYFAGFAKHIGFYATPKGHEAFQSKLAGYKQGKGSVQFPLSQPIPLDLISEIVRFKQAEILDNS